MTNKLIPENKKGKQTHLDTSIHLVTKEAAALAFDTACKRLLAPGSWHDRMGKLSAEFKLMDMDGKELTRPAQEGDYIRIDIPGPGLKTGEGYDWVKVALIEKSGDAATGEQSVGMKLQTCPAPVNEGNQTAHFFEAGASSSFLIRLEGKEITAEYYGRNEKINNTTGNAADNIRNTAVALGAIAGLSELQWSKLIETFLDGLEKE